MQIKKAAYSISSPEVSKCPAGTKPEFAFIGRSNVGKSSLINALTGNSKLAKTSSAPGKTQMINHFDITSSVVENGVEQLSDWYIVDLPGYGFAKVSMTARRRWEQMIENYFRKRENLAHVFVLIDSRHQPQKIDLEFISNLRKWEIPFSLIFTKSDKENQRTVTKNVNDFIGLLKKGWPFVPAHFVTSSLKQTGRQKVLDYIREIMTEGY